MTQNKLLQRAVSSLFLPVSLALGLHSVDVQANGSYLPPTISYYTYRYSDIAPEPVCNAMVLHETSLWQGTGDVEPGGCKSMWYTFGPVTSTRAEENANGVLTCYYTHNEYDYTTHACTGEIERELGPIGINVDCPRSDG